MIGEIRLVRPISKLIGGESSLPTMLGAFLGRISAQRRRQQAQVGARSTAATAAWAKWPT